MNNKTFYLKYIELTIKNNNISVVKQVLISIVAFFGMAILSLFDMYLLKVIILIYLLLSSFILFIDNEVFLNIEDIENLMIRSSDRRFPIVFIIQRYFRDTYIFNTILLFILFIYTGIFNQNVFLWLCITILFYYGSVPYEYLANYKNNYLIIMNVMFKLFVIACIIIAYINHYRILDLSIGIYAFGWILYAGVQFILSKKKNHIFKNNSDISYLNKGLRLIKNADIFVFKDVIMNFKYIMIAVVSSFLMMIMLGISNSEIYALLSFCIILDSYLSNKNDKKKYRIIADDPIFWNLRYPYEDVKFLKKKKFLTFAFVGVLKNIIMISILLSQNSFNLLSYCSLCILSMIVCINDYLKIYNGGNLHKWVFIGINYILVFTYIVTLIIGNINRICINALLLIILAFAIFILIKNIKVKEEVYYQE